MKNLGISNKNQLVEKRRWTDSEGYQHVKYRQVFEGFEIPSAEFTLHLRDGDVEIAHGFLVEDAKLQIGKLIDENDALAVAMQTVNATIFKWEDESEENDLKERAGDFKATYYPKAIKKLLSRSPNISIDALVPCYEFTIYSLEPYDARIIAVDARNGQIFSNLPAYREICTPSGTNQAQTLYNGNQYITTAKEGTKYYLKDCSANFEVRQYAASWSNAQRLEDADNIWNHDQDCVGAFWAISKSRTYFSAKYGDYYFSGGRVKMNAPNTQPWINNAFYWSDSGTPTIEVGTSSAGNDMAAIDIMGHEFTHGVIDALADLNYEWESGALNESFADIFGTMVEQYAQGNFDWTIGEDALLVRSMSSPNTFGQPHTYGGTFWFNVNGCTPTNNNDHCGVHTNSGVQNKWFHLLCVGGTQNGITVSGIGTTKAANIAYRNLGIYLQSTSNYAAARTGAIQSARDLYGYCSNEALQVEKAWAAVGVGSAPAVCVDITGPTTICNVIPDQFTAIGATGTTFSWIVPSNWSYTVSGTGNKYLNVSSVTQSSTTNYTISVIASLSGSTGSDSKVVTVQNCYGDTKNIGSEFIEENSVTISPNPSRHHIFIVSNDHYEYQLKIWNINGQLMFESDHLPDSSIEVNLWPSGMYQIELLHDSVRIMKRIVITD